MCVLRFHPHNLNLPDCLPYMWDNFINVWKQHYYLLICNVALLISTLIAYVVNRLSEFNSLKVSLGVMYAFHAMAPKLKLNHSFVFHECSMIIEIPIFTYAITWKCMYCGQQFLIFDHTFRWCMLFSILLKECSKLFVPWCCITEKGVCKYQRNTVYT